MTLTTHLKGSSFPMPRTDPKRWEALKRDLGIVPSEGISLSDDLPHPANEFSFITQNIKYTALRYENGKGPTLKQTIAIAEYMGYQVLTIEEARAIVENKESNTAFLDVLNEGEWAYIRDPESEKQSRAAGLVRSWGGRLGVYDGGPDDAASVVVLSESD